MEGKSSATDVYNLMASRLAELLDLLKAEIGSDVARFDDLLDIAGQAVAATIEPSAMERAVPLAAIVLVNAVSPFRQSLLLVRSGVIAGHWRRRPPWRYEPDRVSRGHRSTSGSVEPQSPSNPVRLTEGD